MSTAPRWPACCSRAPTRTAPRACCTSTAPAALPSCRTRRSRCPRPCRRPRSSATSPTSCCRCARSAPSFCDWTPAMPIDVESKLLIVDDLPENLLPLEALVRGPDRPVYRARSAEEALALLLEHEFALAIVDVQMPAMNGFELGELMRIPHPPHTLLTLFVRDA